LTVSSFLQFVLSSLHAHIAHLRTAHILAVFLTVSRWFSLPTELTQVCWQWKRTTLCTYK